MNQQFIQAVQFDWNRIDPDSYLNHIEAFQGIERLDFQRTAGDGIQLAPGSVLQPVPFGEYPL